MNKRIVLFGLIGFGGLLLLCGLLLMLLVPNIIQNSIAKEIYLGLDENGTYNEMTAAWAAPKYSMESQFFIYSVKNQEEILNGGFPKFARNGPYVFTENQYKSKVRFLQNGTRVIYRNQRVYTFDEKKSCQNCSLADEVIIPNLSFQILIDIVNAHPTIRVLVELILQLMKTEGPFIKTTVGEMLFDGYEDPLITKICEQIKTLCDMVDLPRKISFLVNNTDDGEYYIDSGLTDSRNIAKVYAWNGRNTTSNFSWYDQYARMINGTDGQMFSPGLSKNNDLFVFSGQLGRSIFFRYENADNIEDLSVYQFSFSKDVYNWLLPENRGFCSGTSPIYLEDSKLQPDGCLPLGLLDLSSTRPGKPRVILSASHFLDVPEELYMNYTGIPKPDPELDRTHLDIEPVTGTVVHVRESSQLNIGMISADLKIVQKMRNLVVPVFSMYEIIHFDSETRRKLLLATKIKETVNIFGLIILIAGCFIMFIPPVVAGYLTYFKRTEDEELLIPNEQQEDDDVEE